MGHWERYQSGDWGVVVVHERPSTYRAHPGHPSSPDSVPGFPVGHTPEAGRPLDEKHVSNSIQTSGAALDRPPRTEPVPSVGLASERRPSKGPPHPQQNGTPDR